MIRRVSIMLFVFILFATGCTNTSPTQTITQPASEIAFNLDEYKESIIDCMKDISAVFAVIGDVSSTEFVYWATNAVEQDNLAESAFEKYEREHGVSFEDVKLSHKALQQKYKKIAVAEITGREAEEIRKAFVSCYEAYNSFYEIVISPKGKDAYEFNEKTITLMGDISKTSANLRLFLN